MNIITWTPCNQRAWDQQHGDILSFVRKYGRRRISSEVYRTLMKLSYDELIEDGSSVLLANIQTEDGTRLAGFSIVTAYGKKISLVLIHPLYRGRGIGSKLLARQLDFLGQLTCQVALDNIPCLKMCFHAGLSAKRLIIVRGGRTELLLDDKPSSSNSAANLLQRR
ncbi:Acetyltransferase (GNAT) family protein [Fontibacillus panacisegetis]|uniref:Acetyltransferase (GNAT) family protein n=1 Tax=Fontibacillus panacisegetis TaxID=670482 RepID=A0A1G7K6B6_9BACL|nr:GNAT family N-acetyltransferase [Fontibacillus panacisegetis]SDF32795.1 Acetyltransferase (GNAT) family protein [Fontibacillus panacisegetis]